MSAISAADNSFLALSSIGTGEKYLDAPDFIHAAFHSLSTPPSMIDTIILPKPSISVLALVAYSLPIESPVKPLPDPFSYFTKEDPHPTNSASIQLLKSLPIPPLTVSLHKLSDRQVRRGWMSTHQLSTSTLAIFNAFNSGYLATGSRSPKFFQLGMLGRSQIAILPYFRRSPLRLLTVQQTSFAPCFTLYHGTAAFMGFIHGFSDTDNVCRLADFASEHWLADIHETFMLKNSNAKLLPGSRHGEIFLERYMN
jgi:hypothetical protein